MKIFRAPPPGFEADLPRPVFSWAGLWSTEFQPKLEAFATQKLGFRKWLLRPRNQLSFSLFREPRNQIILGKQGMLFEKEPLRAAMGRDKVLAPAEVQASVQRLRTLQDTLARRGKLLLFVVAPSKAALYPENWPDSCQSQWNQPSNYERLRQPMQAVGLNLLDLSALFRAWKATSPHPLFPQGGIHWSGYGLTRAADTLRQYFHAHSHFQLPAVRQTGLVVGAPPRYTDDDLLKVLNLYVDPSPNPPLAYPELAFEAPNPGSPRPRVLLVADSFGWGLVEFYPYFDNWFAPGSQYWYYNNEVVWPKVNGAVEGPVAVADRDMRVELATHDVVLLLFGEQTLGEVDCGFSEAALRTFQQQAN
ncbi:hypothetical protein MTX78_21465 [Hymenobacter tibetensis]|uniref:AlgX/AlgJ SGNH hydrolase-like domain-containing protein n=1 Tax=Hymenobacter tibetensis TaxID=497967 RepID=A0ABY4CWM8_9BACT|nr:hypothetical protein [Hymenobacter tibetensis]UOG74674.1 hypothetical protein MTX78_21465 [Hymenobacter tibetensis]